MYLCTRNGRRLFCPDGGIGRRVGLKHQWSDPCRFDPGSGYEEIDWLSDFYHLANFFISIAPLPLFWSRLDLPVILLNGSQHFDFLIILVENRVQMRRQWRLYSYAKYSFALCHFKSSYKIVQCHDSTMNEHEAYVAENFVSIYA